MRKPDDGMLGATGAEGLSTAVVTVVIPLYNMAQLIGRAINSVLAQTVQAFELVVVDDGSQDGGGDIVSAYRDRRIRVVRQSNAGVSAARNRGVAEATCELIAFLDADDWWQPNHLEEILRLRRRYPDAAMYATAFVIEDDDGLIRPVRLIRPPGEKIAPAEYFEFAARSNPPVHSSCVVIPRTNLRQIGGFPECVENGEDLLTWARLACTGVLAYSYQITSTNVADPLASSIRRDHVRKPPKKDIIGAELRALAHRHGAEWPALHWYVGNWTRMRAIHYVELGNHLEAFREIWRSVCADRLRGRDLAIAVLNCLPFALSSRVLEAVRRRRHRQLASRWREGQLGLEHKQMTSAD